VLKSIEVCRGIAALLVAFYHLSRLYQQNYNVFPFTRVTEIGHIGVDFFFVLSGFIIYFIHKNDIGVPNTVLPYLKKRCARVYPFFWFVIFLNLLLIPFVSSKELPTLSQLFANLLLIPYRDYFVIGVSWTLQHEILFYLFFSMLLIQKTFGFILMGLWLASIIIKSFIFPDSTLFPTLFAAFNLQFFFGLFVGYLYKNNKLIVPNYLLSFSMLFLLMVILLELLGILNGFDKWARILYGLAFSLLLISCIRYEEKRKYSPPRILLELGKSSYAIYLLHLFYGGIIFKLMTMFYIHEYLPITLSALFTIILTVFFSHKTSQLVEIPLTKYVRNKLLYKA
jgi:exopolysaccharide production protein ExoZ